MCQEKGGRKNLVHVSKILHLLLLSHGMVSDEESYIANLSLFFTGEITGKLEGLGVGKQHMIGLELWEG